MDEIKTIVNDIKKGQIHPIYFLMGDEPYYIDSLTKYIENNVLQEEEKGFNQVVLYGRDVDIDEVVSQAKRYPMMAERQVVIVREAHHLSRQMDRFQSYAEQPQPTTVLVFAYKGKTLDKRKKVFKAVKKNGVILETKKLYENQIPDWIRRVLKGSGYQIDPKAAEMLVEFLGNDLGRISNELDKLKGVIDKTEMITPEHIETNIGISKDFNNFELKSAIAERNVLKAGRIIRYFAQNPSDNPVLLSVALLHSFFSQVLAYQGLPNHNDKYEVAKAIGVRGVYPLRDISTAARNYPMKKVSAIISVLREIDAKSKGVGVYQLPPGDLYKELMFKIMY
ncbi:DNA polymerase III subunit delta [Robertkochia sediminum]|uniref:DNA polymerase III subunit delta n=1 Tax=Robertkochia sediminum TaxID=2785326 RepID=UPI0019331047|nr:DNA polymerase III subunit delta [Robertkochia sediminum]MBL7473582.1 DNA polymerase III subunit delta [Robertkochia sediminum]